MLGRIYSIALAVVMTEALVNGFSQLEFLDPVIFWASAIAIILAVLGVVVSQWFIPSQVNFWLRAVSTISLVLLLTWPLHFDPEISLPDTFQPWIWWTLGISAVAAGTTFRFSIGVSYLIFQPLAWLILKTSQFGGSGEILIAIQESLYLFIFASILVAMVLALRWEAGKTDSANQLAISSAVESARVDAIEIERSRLDALVHDSVLTTMLVASRASSDSEVISAQKLAKDAIERLQNAAAPNLIAEKMTLASYFGALELRIRENASEFTVGVERVSDFPISSDIAQALTEATLQAVDNSLKHAGSAKSRSVKLRGLRNGLKIVITDDGRGFRPSQIPKNRLGISASIISRVQNVGGRVFIQSAPGQGATVVIEWGSND